MLRQEMEYYTFIIWHTTQTTTNNVKRVNMAVDLFTDIHAVANGGDLSFEYHHGAFLRILKI